MRDGDTAASPLASHRPDIEGGVDTARDYLREKFADHARALQLAKTPADFRQLAFDLIDAALAEAGQGGTVEAAGAEGFDSFFAALLHQTRHGDRDNRMRAHCLLRVLNQNPLSFQKIADELGFKTRATPHQCYRKMQKQLGGMQSRGDKSAESREQCRQRRMGAKRERQSFFRSAFTSGPFQRDAAASFFLQLTMSAITPLSERVAEMAEGNYVERLAALNAEIRQGVAAIAAWFRFSAERMIESGRILCEAQENMRGDFRLWFESNQEKIGYSFSTANLSMRVFRNYVLRGRDLDKDLQDFKSQQEFLHALGISERPECGKNGAGQKPLFRLAMAINVEPEKWSPIDRREFLLKFEELEKIADRVRAIEGEA